MEAQPLVKRLADSGAASMSLSLSSIPDTALPTQRIPATISGQSGQGLRHTQHPMSNIAATRNCFILGSIPSGPISPIGEDDIDRVADKDTEHAGKFGTDKDPRARSLVRTLPVPLSASAGNLPNLIWPGSPLFSLPWKGRPLS